jgi:hypothetical protein
MMPYNYSYSLLLALAPPLWFASMDPLLEKREPKNEQSVRGFFIAFLVWLAYVTYTFA